MLQRLGIGLLASVVGLSTCFLIGRGIAGPPQGKSIGLTVSVYEQLPSDKKAKLLAEPTLHAWPGRKASFLSGGEISSKFDDSLHEIGTKFQAIITPHSADTYELKMEFTLGTDLTNEKRSETELFHYDTINLRTILKSGETKKISISPTRWYALKLQTVEPFSGPRPRL